MSSSINQMAGHHFLMVRPNSQSLTIFLPCEHQMRRTPHSITTPVSDWRQASELWEWPTNKWQNCSLGFLWCYFKYPKHDLVEVGSEQVVLWWWWWQSRESRVHRGGSGQGGSQLFCHQMFKALYLYKSCYNTSFFVDIIIKCFSYKLIKCCSIWHLVIDLLQYILYL